MPPLGLGSEPTSWNVPIESVMTHSRDLVFLTPKDTLEDARALMSVSGKRHIPVLDGTRLLGVISPKAIARALHFERNEDVTGERQSCGRLRTTSRCTLASAAPRRARVRFGKVSSDSSSLPRPHCHPRAHTYVLAPCARAPMLARSESFVRLDCHEAQRHSATHAAGRDGAG